MKAEKALREAKDIFANSSTTAANHNVKGWELEMVDFYQVPNSGGSLDNPLKTWADILANVLPQLGSDALPRRRTQGADLVAILIL